MKLNFFECKVKYMKVMENGLQKPVTEAYLVDALSYTEAESRFIEEIRPFMHGAFEVDSITRVKISDIFFNDKESADKWYKCKITLVTIDEVSAKEKKTPVLMLVKAESVPDAISRLNIHMSTSVMDYELTSVNNSPIIDIFQYQAL